MKTLFGIIMLGLLVAGCSSRDLTEQARTQASTQPAQVVTTGDALDVDAADFDGLQSIEKELALDDLDNADADFAAIDSAFQ